MYMYMCMYMYKYMYRDMCMLPCRKLVMCTFVILDGFEVEEMLLNHEIDQFMFIYDIH